MLGQPSSLSAPLQHEILERVDVALQIRARGIAAHHVAQQRECALEVLLIDGELRERHARVLAIAIERARALERELRAVVIAVVAVGLAENQERLGVLRIELHGFLQ